ncbi:hypothetical protein ACGFK1_20040 [Mycobacterium sp. NPDC048908]|uniref:hypothetical protein n=1 Tax=Mycobacterium sp. NPDC048908 TaxID=3364292 RepID=UPI003720B615
MTEREAPPGLGFEYRRDDPYENDGWFGGERVADPTYVDEVSAPPREPVTPVRPNRFEAPSPPAPARTNPTVSTWTINGQLRASGSSTLTFRPPPRPWYRTKQAAVALLVVAAAALIVPIAVLVLPDNSSPAPGPSTSVAPRPATPQPSPTTAASTPINVPPPTPPPAPAPPPPSPPPSPQDGGSAPTYDEPYWTRPAPEPTAKAPTPVTRSPISVAPVPRKPTERNSLGESDKPGCAGWC